MLNVQCFRFVTCSESRESSPNNCLRVRSPRFVGGTPTVNPLAICCPCPPFTKACARPPQAPPHVRRRGQQGGMGTVHIPRFLTVAELMTDAREVCAPYRPRKAIRARLVPTPRTTLVPTMYRFGENPNMRSELARTKADDSSMATAAIKGPV